MQISPEIGSHNPLMPVDTLAISKRLQAAGTPKKQAETQAEVWGEIITQNLASKTDIEMLRNASRMDIERLHNASKTDIEMLRNTSKMDIARIEEKIEVLRKDTKTDIAKVEEKIEALRKDTKTDIENLRKDLTIEIEKIKTDIMKWIIPLMAGQLLATAGLFKFFSH